MYPKEDEWVWVQTNKSWNKMRFTLEEQTTTTPFGEEVILYNPCFKKKKKTLKYNEIISWKNKKPQV